MIHWQSPPSLPRLARFLASRFGCNCARSVASCMTYEIRVRTHNFSFNMMVCTHDTTSEDRVGSSGNRKLTYGQLPASESGEERYLGTRTIRRYPPNLPYLFRETFAEHVLLDLSFRQLQQLRHHDDGVQGNLHAIDFYDRDLTGGRCLSGMQHNVHG